MSLPTFLVIGTARAGTTSLWHYLRQHPDVFMCDPKEPHLFLYERGVPDQVLAGAVTTMDEYERLFDPAGDARAVGEASSWYLYGEKAADAIARNVPDARLIAVLRRPEERAFAHFVFNVSRGVEPLVDFGAALDAEDQRVASGSIPGFHYRRAGRYAEQLARYGKWLDSGRLRVFLYDDLVASPAKVVADAFRFLAVDDVFVPDMSTRHNRTQIPRSRALQRWLLGHDGWARAKRVLPKPLRVRGGRWLWDRNTRAMEPPLDVMAELRAGYRDDVAALEEMIGRDLSRWR